MASLNLAECPHPRSQQTVLARQATATKYLCLTCGLEHWVLEEQKTG